MFDGLRFLRDYHIPYYSSGKNIGSEWVGLRCPFHEDHSSHLGFNIAGGYFYCWHCGSIRINKVIQFYTGVNSNEVYSIKKQYEIVEQPIRKKEKKNRIRNNLHIPTESLPETAKEYLRNRGYDIGTIISKYKLSWGGLSGTYKYRIIIPFMTPLKEIVSFQSRSIYPNVEPKYLSAYPEDCYMSVKELLFNYNHAERDSVIVVEGPFDAIRLGDDCVATCGINLTSEQLNLLTHYRNIYILFDNEPKAQKQGCEYAEELSALGVKTVEVVRLAGHKDPGDLTDEEALELKREILGV